MRSFIIKSFGLPFLVVALSGIVPASSAWADDLPRGLRASIGRSLGRDVNNPTAAAAFDTEKKITASDAAAVDFFGTSVAISGDTVIVGARFEDVPGSSSGSAYVYRRDEGGVDNWGEVMKLTASDAADEDFFGQAVAISGDTAIVGAPLNEDDGDDSGSAYVYQRDLGGSDNWGEVTKAHR